MEDLQPGHPSVRVNLGQDMKDLQPGHPFVGVKLDKDTEEICRGILLWG